MTDDLSDPAQQGDRDRVMRIIMARCGDVLTEADLALLGDAAPDPDGAPGDHWRANPLRDRPHDGPTDALVETVAQRQPSGQSWNSGSACAHPSVHHPLGVG
jgi:hypothetical protein